MALLSFSANSSAGTLKNTHCCAKSSAGDLFFQCKQLGWYTVVNTSQHKQLGWCFILSVQTARLVHYSKLILAQTARLVLYPFSADSSAGTL
jgi:hypothetical protein